VWTTQNGGATWYPLGQGLPFQAIFDLYLHTGARQLFAGTHGRSMWKVDLAQIPTAVGEPAPRARLALSAPSPNPSGGTTRFSLTLDRETPVNVSVFDALGRRVGVVHDGPLAAGRYAFSWDGRESSGRMTKAGVYFVRAEANGYLQTRRLVRTP
jgi:hypothetical protein